MECVEVVGCFLECTSVDDCVLSSGFDEKFVRNLKSRCPRGGVIGWRGVIRSFVG